MKIFSTTSLLSCALSLFMLTATVHGGGSSSSQQEPPYLTPLSPKVFAFRKLHSGGDGPLQIIMEYMDDSQNFIVAVKDMRSLGTNTAEFRRLTNIINPSSNASPEKINEAKMKRREISRSAPYLTAKFPLHINVNLENSDDLLRYLQFERASSGISFVVQVNPMGYNRLSLSNIGLDCALSLTPILSRLIYLEDLCLDNNNIGSEGMRTLAPSLAQLVHLNMLDLRHNNIGPAGAEALAPTLAQLVHLNMLLLGNNNIGSEGMRTLAPNLAQLVHLKILDLAHNNIGPNGALDLAPTLALFTELSYLYLRNNNIGLASAQALAPSLALLTLVGMSDNNLEEAEKQTLREALAHIPGLNLIL